MAHRDTSVSELCRRTRYQAVTLYRYVGLSINGRCSDMRENIQLPKSVLSIGQTTKWVVSVCPTHQGRHTAVEHVPEKHRPLGEWTLDRFIRWAEKIGPDTAAHCRAGGDAAADHRP